MNMLDIILGARNGAAVDQIAGQMGLSKEQATGALGALVPAVAAGLQRNAQNPAGLEQLAGALARGQHAQYLDNPATLASVGIVNDGNAILGHVFGSKDVSREVAERAAAQTGIGADVLKRLLPVAAALAMGTLARQPSTANLQGVLGSTVASNRAGSMLEEVVGAVGGLLRA